MTLVIDHGAAMTPTADPMADALLHGVALAITLWSSARIFWHLGRHHGRRVRRPATT